MRLAVWMLAVIVISLAALLGAAAVFAFSVDDESRALALVSLVVALAGLAAGALVLVRGDRRAKRDRADEAALLGAMLDASRDGMLVFDAASRLEGWNERGLRLLDVPAEL